MITNYKFQAKLNKPYNPAVFNRLHSTILGIYFILKKLYSKYGIYIWKEHESRLVILNINATNADIPPILQVPMNFTATRMVTAKFAEALILQKRKKSFMVFTDFLGSSTVFDLTNPMIWSPMTIRIPPLLLVVIQHVHIVQLAVCCSNPSQVLPWPVQNASRAR